MMRSGRRLGLVMGSLLLVPGLTAVPADVPAPAAALEAETNAVVDAPAPPSPLGSYQGIVDRNVFNLKGLPPPEAAKKEEPPAPKIFVTGITTIFNNKRVVLKMSVPARPNEPAKEESYILAEGMRDGDLEVLAIDEIAGTVKVSNHGLIQTLDWANNGVKSSPAPAGQPGALPTPGNPNPQAGTATVPSPTSNPLRQIPTRTLRLPGQPGSPNAGTPQTPGTTMATPQYNPNIVPPQQGQAGQLSPEEADILIELQREQGGPNAKILPPTRFSRENPPPSPQ